MTRKGPDRSALRSGTRRAAAKPALTPDALIATGKAGRIRLIEKPKPRRTVRGKGVRPDD